MLSQGYVFTDLELAPVVDPITDEEQNGVIRVHYNVGWSTAAFPGTRVCTFHVLDADGASMGHESRYYTGMSSAPEGDRAWIDVAVSGTPSGATVSCEDERLDDPLGHYEFSDIQVVSPSAHPAGDVDLSFSFEWVGTAGPSPQHCMAQVFDGQGDLLGAQKFDFFAAAEAGSTEAATDAATTYIALNPFNEVPESGAISCVPLTAAQQGVGEPST